MKISSKWRHFCFSDIADTDGADLRSFRQDVIILKQHKISLTEPDNWDLFYWQR